MSDGNETLSIEEVSRLLSRLRQADHLRLAALAQTWISGCPRREPVELLNEALSRILSGARPWPVDVPLPAFLSQVMRSIASQWRHEDQREPLLDDADTLRHSDPSSSDSSRPYRGSCLHGTCSTASRVLPPRYAWHGGSVPWEGRAWRAGRTTRGPPPDT